MYAGLFPLIPMMPFCAAAFSLPPSMDAFDEAFSLERMQPTIDPSFDPSSPQLLTLIDFGCTSCYWGGKRKDGRKGKGCLLAIGRRKKCNNYHHYLFSPPVRGGRIHGMKVLCSQLKAPSPVPPEIKECAFNQYLHLLRWTKTSAGTQGTWAF